jgi:hypothetical protein
VEVDEVTVPLAVPEEADEALEGSVVVFEMDVDPVGVNADVGADADVGTDVDVGAGADAAPALVEGEDVERVRDGF